MAGAKAIHTTKPQKPIVEKNQQDPNKFYYNFLYKASIVLIFFVILPLFPSQAPEFINQSLLTRNWELLHLVFVGIAVSYGLFSRRNDETEKENNTKFDTAQSLVSRLLQVSSFFEDEAEIPPESSDEITKVQTWSSQHYRNKPPVVVVAPQGQGKHPDFEEQSGGGGARTREKPLLLPVRSLKSRLSDNNSDAVPSVADGSSYTRSFSLDKTVSKRFSSNSSNRARNAELEGDRVGSPRKENVVLPSPIPWRSRSARNMEPNKLEPDTTSTDQHASKISMEESEFTKVEFKPVKSQIPRSSSRTSPVSSSSSSPKLTPSSESLAKNAEDLLRKKSFYKSCPPPPPPPPPNMFQKSISMRPRHGGSFNNEGASSFDKELKRSFTGERIGRNWNSVVEESGKEVEEEEHSMELEPTRKNTGYASVPLVSEADASSMGYAGEEEKKSFLDKVLVESEDEEDTETDEDEDVGEGRLTNGKESGESPQKPVVEGGTKTEDGASSSSFSGTNMGDEGPDVDKKADEFIAKFREQIRLQRIESIKRSTTRMARNSSR